MNSKRSWSSTLMSSTGTRPWSVCTVCQRQSSSPVLPICFWLIRQPEVTPQLPAGGRRVRLLLTRSGVAGILASDDADSLQTREKLWSKVSDRGLRRLIFGTFTRFDVVKLPDQTGESF